MKLNLLTGCIRRGVLAEELNRLQTCWFVSCLQPETVRMSCDWNAQGWFVCAQPAPHTWSFQCSKLAAHVTTIHRKTLKQVRLLFYESPDTPASRDQDSVC